MTVSDNDGDLRSEVRRLGAERDRLLYELGHRVKNTLSMVQALANQTFRDAASPQDALKTFNERVLALARANDVILAENWTTATLRAVADCVGTVPGCARGPLTIDGPPVRIGAGPALSFAMALHELSTNARRHGAWSVPGGRVMLAWTVEPRPEGDLLDLHWTETGGPAAEPPARRGFGLRLAEQSLRSAFGRDVRVAFEPSGLAARVRAPLAELGA